MAYAGSIYVVEIEHTVQLETPSSTWNTANIRMHLDDRPDEKFNTTEEFGEYLRVMIRLFSWSSQQRF